MALSVCQSVCVSHLRKTPTTKLPEKALSRREGAHLRPLCDLRDGRERDEVARAEHAQRVRRGRAPAVAKVDAAEVGVAAVRGEDPLDDRRPAAPGTRQTGSGHRLPSHLPEIL